MRISDWSSDVCSSDLVQTIGRAARNVDGRVILYAARITGSMERAMRETDRRREKQEAYNVEHGLTPTTTNSNIGNIIAHDPSKKQVTLHIGDDKPAHIVEKENVRQGKLV